MKRRLLFLLAAALLPIISQPMAICAAATSQAASFVVVARGANFNILQKTNSDGSLHQITQIASGLNYTNSSGQWMPTLEEIDGCPGGATAQFGPHKVTFANNLNTAGAVDMQLPDNQVMQSDILGLSYYDSSSGNAVLIAQVKDCQGQIADSNQVVYSDAFSGVTADVRYIYTLAGLEQDVVLRSQPPKPELFGLSSTSSVLQVLTEFTASPSPQIKALPAAPGCLPDEILDFGTMKMVRGKAFLIGTNSDSAPVSKQWTTINGRVVLIESVPLAAISKQLPQLAESYPIRGTVATSLLASARSTEKDRHRLNSVQAGSERSKPSPLYVASARRLLPPPRNFRRTPARMELAKAKAILHGLVLDYITLNSTLQDYTFSAGTTYFVSGSVYCSGNTTIQGGAVFKYPFVQNANSYNPSGPIEIGGTLTLDTTPLNRAIFTAEDDDSVGERLTGAPGYTGTLQTGDDPDLDNYFSSLNNTYAYADPALALDSQMNLSNLRFTYCATAISFNDSGYTSDAFIDLQITNCGIGIECGMYGNGSIDAGRSIVITNSLCGNLQLIADDATDDGWEFSNCTFDNIANANSGGSGGAQIGLEKGTGQVNFDNCVLADITSPAINFTGNNNGFFEDPAVDGYGIAPFGANQVSLDPSTSPFTTGALGDHYLPDTSLLINAGSTTANQLGLYHYTTQVSEVKEGSSTVDIGYHYVAVNGSGQPLDSNSDGIPDYIEDSNGDGVYEAADLGDWKPLTPDVTGLVRLQIYTPLKGK